MFVCVYIYICYLADEYSWPWLCSVVCVFVLIAAIVDFRLWLFIITDAPEVNEGWWWAGQDETFWFQFTGRLTLRTSCNRRDNQVSRKFDERILTVGQAVPWRSTVPSRSFTSFDVQWGSARIWCPSLFISDIGFAVVSGGGWGWGSQDRVVGYELCKSM